MPRSVPARRRAAAYTGWPCRARGREWPAADRGRDSAEGRSIEGFTLSTQTLHRSLSESVLPGLPLRHRGKVRDVFDIPADRLPDDTPSNGGHLLMVATDRLSAFDVVLPDPIPGKGEMLCQISNFWFGRTEHRSEEHTSELQSRENLVCRLLLEKKNAKPH